MCSESIETNADASSDAGDGVSARETPIRAFGTAISPSGDPGIPSLPSAVRLPRDGNGIYVA